MSTHTVHVGEVERSGRGEEGGRQGEEGIERGGREVGRDEREGSGRGIERLER